MDDVLINKVAIIERCLNRITEETIRDMKRTGAQ